MDNVQHKAFHKLRPPCVALSSVTLKFRGQQASIKSLLQALQALYKVLVECSQPNLLDAKLAEYAFFPLSGVFNEGQRLSSRCLEVAVRSLHILVSKGWGQKLTPEMGKQLLILLGLLAGRSPARPEDQTPSEELVCACFECMTVLVDVLGKPKKPVFEETGRKTSIDQNVYILLEAITDNPSDAVQSSALAALSALLSQIRSRALLASLLPRTVSALTKVAVPSTQMRRSGRVLAADLALLTFLLRMVLADSVALGDISEASSQEKNSDQKESDEELVLDAKWLKATVTQIKLALANLLKLRSHEKDEVRNGLFNLCLTVCEACSKTLIDSLPLMLSSAVMLADPRQELSARNFHAMKHLIISKPDLEYLIRDSLYSWVNALPRVMQGNDERPKCLLLRQVSTAVQILLEVGDSSNLPVDELASNLIEAISIQVEAPSKRSLEALPDGLSTSQLTRTGETFHSKTFLPLLLYQGGQTEILKELQGLISCIKSSSMQQSLARSLMDVLPHASGAQKLSTLYLSLNLLKSGLDSSFSLSDILDLPDDSNDTTAHLISDLYSIALPILLDESSLSHDQDWRIHALALESIVLQATQLQNSYRPELIDTLFPALSLLGSQEPRLQSHAITALNLIASACQYPDTATMLVDNVDYLINSIALKLNTFDFSPQGPLVLLMMLRLCGARLLPFLDDLISSIFAALDNFHGYPRLVELLFKVLAAVVDEASKNPQLAIMSGTKEPNHKKKPYKPSTIDDILADVRAHREKKEKREAEVLADDPEAASIPTPRRPWSSKLDGPQDASKASHEEDETEGEPAQTPKEPKEPPLPKPHTLLLAIARSTVPHLSSPSPTVRLTLLNLLTQLSPLLSRHENTFLPLINDIWPALVPRLFAGQNQKSNLRGGFERGTHLTRPTRGRLIPSDNTDPSDSQNGGDPPYVTIAALDTVTALCIGAGDFMSGRIEEIFPGLENMYARVYGAVERERARREGRQGKGRGRAGENDGSELKGTVDLRIINPLPIPPALSSSVSPSPLPSSTSFLSLSSTQSPLLSLSSSTTNTPSLQKLHSSLTHLLITILTHVFLRANHADAIFSMLMPLVDQPGFEDVGRELREWNTERFWLLRGAK